MSGQNFEQLVRCGTELTTIELFNCGVCKLDDFLVLFVDLLKAASAEAFLGLSNIVNRICIIIHKFKIVIK